MSSGHHPTDVARNYVGKPPTPEESIAERVERKIRMLDAVRATLDNPDLADDEKLARIAKAVRPFIATKG